MTLIFHFVNFSRRCFCNPLYTNRLKCNIPKFSENFWNKFYSSKCDEFYYCCFITLVNIWFIFYNTYVWQSLFSYCGSVFVAWLYLLLIWLMYLWLWLVFYSGYIGTNILWMHACTCWCYNCIIDEDKWHVFGCYRMCSLTLYADHRAFRSHIDSRISTTSLMAVCQQIFR